jgi:hypothetical protein
LRRGSVKNIRRLRRVDELQILRDELDIDQASGDVFEIPPIAIASLRRDGVAHFKDIGGDHARVTRPA